MAAHGRGEETPEAPRTVYLGACEWLAGRFAPLGFHPQRMNQDLVRRRGPWQHEISFASSHYNRTGEFVALRPTVIVGNRDLERWRREIGGGSGRFIASEMLYHFANAAIGTDWDLADPVKRSGVLEDVASLLTEKAMAWFDLFDERLEVLARWDFNNRLLHLDAVVELLLFLGRPGDALSVVQEATTREPWSHFDVGAPVFANVRKLGAAFSIDFPVPSGRDPAVEAAAVERLRAALDAYTQR